MRWSPVTAHQFHFESLKWYITCQKLYGSLDGREMYGSLKEWMVMEKYGIGDKLELIITNWLHHCIFVPGAMCRDVRHSMINTMLISVYCNKALNLWPLNDSTCAEEQKPGLFTSSYWVAIFLLLLPITMVATKGWDCWNRLNYSAVVGVRVFAVTSHSQCSHTGANYLALVYRGDYLPTAYCAYVRWVVTVYKKFPVNGLGWCW